MVYLSLILLPLCILLFYLLKNKEKEIEKEKNKAAEIQNLKLGEIKEYFREEWNKSQREFDLESSKLDTEIRLLNKELTEKEKRYNEVNQDLDLYKKGKIKEIDEATAEYEHRKRLENAHAIEAHNNSMKKASAELQEQLMRTEEVLRSQIEEIKNELEEERRKRAVVNEEILRQRKIEEDLDFYRIQLDPLDKKDIEILKDTAARLRRPEAINKIIWSAYYQKPLAELRKRAGVEGSGVYKITRLKTNEIYIGQAVNISTRWAEHCKSALGVGTLASSQLHRKMAEDGCENFTFEVLEEVPKEKLRERESYYIDFYDSKMYGLNSVKGDQK